MNRTDSLVTSAAAAGLALALALAGCSSKDEKPAASSSSSSSASTTPSAQVSATPTADPEEPAEALDYDALLMAPEDIPATPAPFVLRPPQLNFNGTPGVLAEYSTEDGMAGIIDAITVTPGTDFADKLLASMTADIASMVTGTPVPSPIGTNGLLVEGTSPEGTNARTILMFSQDNSVVMLQFESAPGDMGAAPTDFVNTVGQLQLDAVNANLASVPVPPSPTPTP